MHGFPSTRDNPAKAPYSTLEEEDRIVPTDSKRRWRPADLRYLILLAVAFLMAGVLVAAVAFLIADKTNKTGSVDGHADNSGHFVVDDFYLELDQKHPTDAEHVVTVRRNLKGSRGGGRLGSVIETREQSGLPAGDSSSYADDDDMHADRAQPSRRQSADSFAVPGKETGLHNLQVSKRMPFLGCRGSRLQIHVVNLRGDHGGLDTFSHKEAAFCSERRTCPSVPAAAARAATRQFDVSRAIGAASSLSWRRCRRQGYQRLTSSPGACMERL
ncbi:hypothetical protein V5799_023740 [Amblyomma americanum]|uniref:Uncharacterized protein n=1 Tax=Amblyomma americanum TaxID=6943 RepID=A0AAQ4FGM3_AMBAM